MASVDEVRPRPLTPILVLAAAAVLGALILEDAPVAPRLVLAVPLVLLGPGTAIVGVLGLPPTLMRRVLVVAVSLASTVLVSEALVLTDRLTPEHALAALAGLCAPFCLVQLWRGRAGTMQLPRPGTLVPPPRLHPAMVATAGAAVLWLLALLQVDPTLAGAMGMISALPVTWWLGVAALTLGFVLHLREDVHGGMGAVQVGLLIAFLFGTLTIAQPYSRIPTSYTHVGLVDYIVRDGSIVSSFDARFSWPGSLTTSAMLTQLTGAESSITFVRWAIPVFLGLWSMAVHATASAFAISRKGAWVAVWLFLCLNWVGQDYWSPQALNFFLVLAVVAGVATWMPRRRFRNWVRRLPFEQPAGAFVTTGQGLGLLLVFLLIACAVASSHQLSPFMLAGGLVVLWAVDRRDIRFLPLLVLLLAITWISWGAYDYWIGHFDNLTRDVGEVGGVVSAGTSDRLEGGAAARRIVLVTRLGLSLSAWVLAAVAFIALRRRTASAFVVGALVLVPFGSVALQSYGGELGLRVFLFGLPFIAILLAEALTVHLGRLASRRVVGAVVGASLVLTAAFVIARYGNEQFEQTFPEDMRAVRAVYDAAPPGSVVLAANTANAFRVGPYHDYRFYRVTELAVPDLDAVRETLVDQEIPRAYILVTRAGVNNGVLVQGSARGWDRALGRQLARAGARRLFREGHAAVYVYDVTEGTPR